MYIFEYIFFRYFIRIYSVGVWNEQSTHFPWVVPLLEFTPLEFETWLNSCFSFKQLILEFTPLEFETDFGEDVNIMGKIRIYSVGVWNNLE